MNPFESGDFDSDLYFLLKKIEKNPTINILEELIEQENKFWNNYIFIIEILRKHFNNNDILIRQKISEIYYKIISKYIDFTENDIKYYHFEDYLVSMFSNKSNNDKNIQKVYNLIKNYINYEKLEKFIDFENEILLSLKILYFMDVHKVNINKFLEDERFYEKLNLNNKSQIKMTNLLTKNHKLFLNRIIDVVFDIKNLELYDLKYKIISEYLENNRINNDILENIYKDSFNISLENLEKIQKYLDFDQILVKKKEIFDYLQDKIKDKKKLLITYINNSDEYFNILKYMNQNKIMPRNILQSNFEKLNEFLEFSINEKNNQLMDYEFKKDEFLIDLNLERKIIRANILDYKLDDSLFDKKIVIKNIKSALNVFNENNFKGMPIQEIILKYPHFLNDEIFNEFIKNSDIYRINHALDSKYTQKYKEILVNIINNELLSHKLIIDINNNYKNVPINPDLKIFINYITNNIDSTSITYLQFEELMNFPLEYILKYEIDDDLLYEFIGNLKINNSNFYDHDYYYNHFRCYKKIKIFPFRISEYKKLKKILKIIQKNNKNNNTDFIFIKNLILEILGKSDNKSLNLNISPTKIKKLKKNKIFAYKILNKKSKKIEILVKINELTENEFIEYLKKMNVNILKFFNNKRIQNFIGIEKLNNFIGILREKGFEIENKNIFNYEKFLKDDLNGESEIELRINKNLDESCEISDRIKKELRISNLNNTENDINKVNNKSNEDINDDSICINRNSRINIDYRYYSNRVLMNDLEYLNIKIISDDLYLKSYGYFYKHRKVVYDLIIKNIMKNIYEIVNKCEYDYLEYLIDDLGIFNNYYIFIIFMKVLMKIRDLKINAYIEKLFFEILYQKKSKQNEFLNNFLNKNGRDRHLKLFYFNFPEIYRNSKVNYDFTKLIFYEYKNKIKDLEYLLTKTGDGYTFKAKYTDQELIIELDKKLRQVKYYGIEKIKFFNMIRKSNKFMQIAKLWKDLIQNKILGICFICYGSMLSVVGCNWCGNLFHKKCIKIWMRKGRNSCPLCRKPLSNIF